MRTVALMLCLAAFPAVARTQAPPPAEAASPVRPPALERVEIHDGRAVRSEEVFTPAGEDRVELRAVRHPAEAALHPFWASSCGAFSAGRGERTTFTLAPGAERCRVHLYDGRTGLEDSVLVRRARPRPPVRVVITFGDGTQEAEGVVLAGGRRELDVQARAFDPQGRPLGDFTPEWDLEGGRAVRPDDPPGRLRVRVNAGVDRAVVRARDPHTGAEDALVIEVRD